MTAPHGAAKIKIASLAGLLFAAAFPVWSVQIPVAQDLNGTALKNDYIFNAGFRVNF